MITTQRQLAIEQDDKVCYEDCQPYPNFGPVEVTQKILRLELEKVALEYQVFRMAEQLQ